MKVIKKEVLRKALFEIQEFKEKRKAIDTKLNDMVNEILNLNMKISISQKVTEDRINHL